MKYVILGILGVAAALTMTSCAATPAEPTTAAVTPPPFASAPVEETKAPEDPNAAALTKISNTISEGFESDSFDISYDGKSVIVTASVAGLTDKVTAAQAAETGAPPDWENTVSFAEATGATLADAVEQSGLNSSATVLYVVGDNDNEDIYLTVLNGKVAFTVFDELSQGTNLETISKSEFDSIHTGMSYQDVVNIVGSYGEVLSDVDVMGDPKYRTIMYMWEGEGMTGANANVMIQGGVVASKAQFGLE